MKLFLLVLVVLQTVAFGKPAFANQVPRKPGNTLPVALGHYLNDEITLPNPLLLSEFGRDARPVYKYYGRLVWPILCDLDSDGDGVSNGEALLDPNCTWSGDNSLLADGVQVHPGPKKADPTMKVRIHIIFMSLAWLFFAPAGVLTAVFLKVKTKSVTSVSWFKIHKVCVGTAVYMTLVAYVCMVSERHEILFDQEHTKIGHFVVVLSIVQPLSGFWRIHINPDGSKTMLRLVWEYIHQWTGRVLLILAAIALYYGYDIAKFLDKDLRDGMKILPLVLAAIGALIAMVYVFVRVDERKEPELPTKKKEEKEQGKTKEAENKSNNTSTAESSGGTSSEPKTEKSESVQRS